MTDGLWRPKSLTLSQARYLHQLIESSNGSRRQELLKHHYKDGKTNKTSRGKQMCPGLYGQLVRGQHLNPSFLAPENGIPTHPLLRKPCHLESVPSLNLEVSCLCLAWVSSKIPVEAGRPTWKRWPFPPLPFSPSLGSQAFQGQRSDQRLLVVRAHFPASWAPRSPGASFKKWAAVRTGTKSSAFKGGLFAIRLLCWDL